MRDVLRGQIINVRKWNYTGHEATGGRPALVLSPDWFNGLGYAVIVPLTTPGPNHGFWWEPTIRATDSCCLVPDIRMVPVSQFRSPVRGMATDDELEAVRFALRRLIGGNEEMSDGDCDRGDVWSVDLSDIGVASKPQLHDMLVLHYNSGNGMAMAMFVGTKGNDEAETEYPVTPSSQSTSYSALVGFVRPISVEERLITRVGPASVDETDRAATGLVRFLSSARQRVPG